MNTKIKEKHNKNISIRGDFTRVKLSGSLLKLSQLYAIKKTWIKIVLIIIVSLISGLFGVLFLQNTGLYNVGFEAFAQGTARIASFLVKGDLALKTSVMNVLFWSLIIVINIPLIFFGWKKIGKKFTITTTFYIVVSSLFGLSLGYLPNVENIFLFSKIIPEDDFVNNGVQITLWNSQHDSTGHLSLFIYGFVYGIVQAICYAILFIIGSSSGGLDFIVVWYAEKKYKNLGTIFTYFNVLCFVISYILGTFIPASLTLNDTGNLTNNQGEIIAMAWDFGIFFSPNFMATILMSIVFGITLNSFFPKYQMSKVEIVSRHVEQIRDHIILENKPYSISIKTIEGGYSRLPQKVLVTNCMYVDASYLLEVARKYDPNALFIVTLIKSIDGYVYVSKRKEEYFSIFKFFHSNKNNKNNEIHESRHIHFEIDDDFLRKLDEKRLKNETSVRIIEASEVFDDEFENNEKS